MAQVASAIAETNFYQSERLRLALNSNRPAFSVFVDEEKRSVVTRPGDPNYEPPEGLARGFFDAGNGLVLSYYYTTHTDPHNGTVALNGLSGFKTDLVVGPEEIALLNERNIPTIWLAIYNPERSTGFLEATKHACEKFVAEPPVELKEIYDTRIGLVMCAHSTGAQISIEQANNPEHYVLLKERYSGLIYQSPMLNTAPLFSVLPPSLQETVLDWYISSNEPSALPEETYFGRTHLRLCGRRYTPDPDRALTRPTVGQIEEIRDNARHEILKKQGPHMLAKGDLPVAFFLGAKDKYASSKTSIEFAKSTGGAIFLDKEGGHSPICENPRNMATFLKVAEEMAQGTFDPSRYRLPTESNSLGSRLRSLAL